MKRHVRPTKMVGHYRQNCRDFNQKEMPLKASNHDWKMYEHNKSASQNAVAPARRLTMRWSK